MARPAKFLLICASVTGCAVSTNPGSSTTDSGIVLDGTLSDTGLDPDSACVAVKEEATLTPANLFIMLDKSSSMTGTKWTGAKAGLAAFLKDPQSTGLRVAINFFPRPPDATPACDQNAYKVPRVPFGELPTNADPILKALEAESPDGFNTPIYPALGGAILGAIAQVTGKPGERGAVLLVTDGEPQGPAPLCSGINPEDPKSIADLAATGAKFTPQILTFVVGLPGASATTLNPIAAAGGTDSAILVTDPTAIEKQFQDALAAVRGRALPCEYPLPSKVAKGEISYGLVNIQYTKGTGGIVTLLQSPDCVGGGWHYDNPSAPTKIILCPTTCSEIRADLKAKIQILLGCKTILK